MIPYFGYARQVEKLHPELQSQLKLLPILTNAGASRVVTVDLHAGQIQGFDMPVDNLFRTLFAKYIKKS